MFSCSTSSMASCLLICSHTVIILPDIVDVLILHLKRFQYVPGQYFVQREKINELIEFPIEGLDLTNYVIGAKVPEAPPIYDLYAVSHHMGGELVN